MGRKITKAELEEKLSDALLGEGEALEREREALELLNNIRLSTKAEADRMKDLEDYKAFAKKRFRELVIAIETLVATYHPDKFRFLHEESVIPKELHDPKDQGFFALRYLRYISKRGLDHFTPRVNMADVLNTEMGDSHGR